MTPTPNPGEARPEPTPELPRTDGDFRPPYFVLENAQSVVYEMEARGYGKEWKLLGLASRSYTERLERSLAEACAKLGAAEKELDYLKDYAIPEKDKHGKYWHDLAQERIAKLTQLESERENWRVSSVNRELARDRERIEYVRKNFANAIHYCCHIDGDEWNTKFYETLDKWMARDADRKGDGK